MNLLDTAIRAACAADVHFTLNRRLQLAQRCQAFLEAFPDAGAEAVYIHAGQQPGWAEAKPETRSAWEIFRATLLILRRAERAEADKKPGPPQRPSALGWLDERLESNVGPFGERIAPAPRAPALTSLPQTLPLPERKKVQAKKKVS